MVEPVTVAAVAAIGGYLLGNKGERIKCSICKDKFNPKKNWYYFCDSCEDTTCEDCIGDDSRPRFCKNDGQKLIRR